MTKKVLVIDDDERCRALISDCLDHFNFEVVTFPDPVTFLNSHSSNCSLNHTKPCFDIILTDNRMPGMRGVDFLQMIDKDFCFLSDTRKAIISGDWTEEDLKRAQHLNCQIFRKPDLTELFHWLEGLNKDSHCAEVAV